MKTLVLSFIVLCIPILASAADKPLYRHVVCLKFKDDASKEQVQAIEKAFAELPKKIDTIVAFEWGTNVSPEKLAQGFTHCFLVSFADRKGLEAYLPHEAHQAFGARLKPILDKVFVFDFVAG